MTLPYAAHDRNREVVKIFSNLETLRWDPSHTPEWTLRVVLKGETDPVSVNELAAQAGRGEVVDYDLSSNRHGRVTSSVVVRIDAEKYQAHAGTGDIGQAIVGKWDQYSIQEGPAIGDTPSARPGELEPQSERKPGTVCIPWMIQNGRVSFGLLWHPRPHVRNDRGSARILAEIPRGFASKLDKNTTATARRESGEELNLPDAKWVISEPSLIASVNANTAFYCSSIPVYQRRLQLSAEYAGDFPAELYRDDPSVKDELEPIIAINGHVFLNYQQLRKVWYSENGVPICSLSASALWLWLDWFLSEVIIVNETALTREQKIAAVFGCA